MGVTTKGLSDQDANQVLQSAYIEEDSTIMTTGFLTGLVGRKVTITVSTTTIANDTETYAFSENGTALYSLKLIYTDATREQLMSAERIA